MKAGRSDPFVQRMALYAEECAEYEARPDDGSEPEPEPGGRLCDEIRTGKVAIANREGALCAMRRLVALDCIIDTEGDCMVEAVIAYLEGRAE